MKPFCSAWLPALLLLCGSAAARAETLFVGTYNTTTSRGIYSLQFDPATGEFSSPVLVAPAANTSFLTVTTDHRYLYTEEESAGQVAAFRIGPGSSQLTLLNRQSAQGQTTAHIAVDLSGKIVMAANYDSGSFCAYAIAADGSLGQSRLFTDQGPTGPNPRQDRPHAHAVTFSPDGQFAAVCDLGMDRVIVYQVKASHGSVTATIAASAATPAGAGPRHSVFSADGRYLYAINELAGSVSVFAWHRHRQNLALVETVSALAPGYHGDAHSAEIALDRTGRFLYASNRGPNDIALFARDQTSGRLTLITNQPYLGANARDFVLSPDGRWLISVNEDSNELVVFQIDPSSGKLSPTGHRASIALPACVAFR